MNEYDKYDNAVPAPVQEEEMEFDIGKMVRSLLSKWKLIALVTFIFGVIGIVAALTMERKWGVTMTLAPEVSGRSSALSSFTNMFGLGDLGLGGGGSDAMRITVFPEICKSTPFLAQLLNVEVSRYASPKEIADGAKVTPTTVFKHLKKEDQPKHKKKYYEAKAEYEQYYNDDVLDISRLTPNQSAAIKFLRNNISAAVDNKTGITTINVVFDDRRMVAQLADTVCNLLQQYVSDYRTKKAVADYNYYTELAEEAKSTLMKAQSAYAAAVDYNRSVILQSINSEKERLQNEVMVAQQIYSQMAQQREMAKAKIQESKPAYAVIQPATEPQLPMNSRKKVVLLWGFAGFFLICAWVVLAPEVKKFLFPEKEENEKEGE